MDCATEKRTRAVTKSLQHHYRNDRRVEVVCIGRKLELSARYEENIDKVMTSLDSLLATIKSVEDIK